MRYAVVKKVAEKVRRYLSFSLSLENILAKIADVRPQTIGPDMGTPLSGWLLPHCGDHWCLSRDDAECLSSGSGSNDNDIDRRSTRSVMAYG